MSEEPGDRSEPSPLERAVDKFLDGGLPQLIAGPAGKAISRLIGGVADIPAAYLEGVAKGIRDGTAARTQISNAISKAAAKLAAKDSELIERSLDRLIASNLRNQMNRESVAGHALEDLASNPPGASSRGPSDDWMNVFEAHAENASSETLRHTWASILAGEIRKPGTFSLQTLLFVSILDPDLARIVENYAGKFDATGNMVEIDSMRQGDELIDLETLESASFLHRGLAFSMELNEEGKGVIAFRSKALIISGPPNGKAQVPIVVCTKVGREITKMISAEESIDYLKEVGRTIQNLMGGWKVDLGDIVSVSESGDVDATNTRSVDE